MAVQFGITIPHFGRNAQPGMVESVAREAEALGFESIWASDHIIVPAGESYIPDYFYDPLIVMTAAAAVTESIEIGVSVLVIPYRDPVVTAKMLATLDQMSRGRIILGTGVGWLEQEFDALNADFHQRGVVCDEYMDVMQALW
ncbi:MAG TPA: LLM class flavin-dependent oxidoreductase, partial [Dehalococcoidia bacterium]|nr:LLM class flavin-dependent oxidoreductase [Dehalococcoidia bacterium]